MLDQKDIKIYSSRDKIREEMIDYMKNYLELDEIDLNKGSFISYLINVLSVQTANLTFYNSSIWREFFLTRAIQKESVLNSARVLGYNPPLSTPATCKLLLTIPLNFDASTTNVTLTLNGKETNHSSPASFKFYTKDGIVFVPQNKITIRITFTSTTTGIVVEENSEDEGIRNLPYDIETVSGVDTLYLVINTIQVESLYSDTRDGQDVNNSFVIPTLKPYEFLVKDLEFSQQLSNKDQEISNLIVRTFNTTSSVFEEWTYYSSLFLIPENINGYTYQRTEKGIRLFFGNGVIGTSPTEGHTCYVMLETTYGTLGNVIAGSINKSDTLYVIDSVGSNQVIRPTNISVINTSPATGGKDSPTIDEIRASAIDNVRANDRFVSKLDFSTIENIAEELPLRNTIHVLKRSDLKRNEIILFSDLLYNDTTLDDTFIVPTRNTTWEYNEIDNTNNIVNKNAVITIDGTQYYSLFDIEVDKSEESSTYYYYQDDIKIDLVNIKNLSSTTRITPSYAKYVLTRNSSNPSLNYYTIKFGYSVILDTIDETDLSCTVTTEWDQTEYSMVLDSSNNEFYTTAPIYVSSVSEDRVISKFKVYYDDGSGSSQIIECSAITIVKQNLDEFMYSQVDVIEDTTGSYDDVTIYDVPVVDKTFYDIVSADSDREAAFDLNVYQKVIGFDVTQYRMLTDFVNLKFSNTTGSMGNMLFNPTTRDPVDDLNPSTMPSSPSSGDRYAVSLDDNPWGIAGGFIAEYISSSVGWITSEKVSTNDFFYSTSDLTYYVFNGETFVEPIQNIPLDIQVIVWTTNTTSETSNALVNRVKNALIENFYPNFGYNKNLYRSEITRVVKSLSGVSNCYCVSPDHDIEFNYDIYTDLTEAELLEYTPELIYFDTNNITVELR